MVLDVGHDTELDRFLAAARDKDDGERGDEDNLFSAHGRRFCEVYSSIFVSDLGWSVARSAWSFRSRPVVDFALEAEIQFSLKGRIAAKFGSKRMEAR